MRHQHQLRGRLDVTTETLLCPVMCRVKILEDRAAGRFKWKRRQCGLQVGGGGHDAEGVEHDRGQARGEMWGGRASCYGGELLIGNLVIFVNI